jgi:hypothetical protein
MYLPDPYSRLIHAYPLQAALVIETSSSTAIGVPANSLQLTRGGNIPRCFIERYTTYIHTYIQIIYRFR